MRRQKNKNKIWIILGGVFLAAAITVGVREIFPSKPPVSAQNVPKNSTAASMLSTASTTIGQMSVDGNTIVARGRNYELSPINELTSPGFFAVEGKIEQIIPNPATKSQTPYYFVIQNSGSSALVGVVVPAGDESQFHANAFPVGANILVAGTIFTSVDPTADIFDYSQLLQGLHVAPGLKQLNLPPGTPYIGANFNNVAVMG